jgi:dipeptidyl aminopeptidase/acylaminoacyl peptidase
MSLLKLLIPIFLLATGISHAVAQEGSDRLTLDLYLEWERVSDPQISPDGQQIIYTRRWIDKMNDRWESSLWIMNSDGSRNRFLAEGSSARWSPDGSRIAFLRSGEPDGTQDGRGGRHDPGN